MTHTTIPLGACPGSDLLLLFAHGLLEADYMSLADERSSDSGADSDADVLAGHLEACPACRSALEALEAELSAPVPVPPAPEVLAGLHERIRAHESEVRSLPPGVVVHLLCLYCKDDLEAVDTVYCASCVAPHHEDCFFDHGHCAAPGCECARVVRSQGAESAPRRRRATRWRGPLLVLFGASLAGGVAAFGSAAFGPREAKVGDASPPGTAAQATPSRGVGPLGAPQGFATSDLVPLPELADGAWREKYRKALESRKVTVNFPQTTLREVVGFLSDVTGLNVVISPELDAERLTCSLRLKDVVLEEVVAAISEQTKVSVELRGGALVFQPWREQSVAQRLAAAAERGGGVSEGIREVRTRLANQVISLNFDQTSLSSVVQFLVDISGLNWVVRDPARLEGAVVTLKLQNVSITDAVEHLFAPHGLGIRLSRAGVIWIVPAQEATESPQRVREARALLDVPCPGPASRGSGFAALEERLRAALPQAHVATSTATRARQERILLPAGPATVRALLETAQLQGTLSYTLSWLDGVPVLLLDSRGEPSLPFQRELAAWAPSDALPASVRAAWPERQRALQAALAAVDSEQSEWTPESLLEALRRVAALSEPAQGLRALATDLEAAAGPAYTELRAAASQRLEDYARRSAELALTVATRQTAEREAEQTWAARRIELAAAAERTAEELRVGEERLQRQRVQVERLVRQGAGPEGLAEAEREEDQLQGEVFRLTLLATQAREALGKAEEARQKERALELRTSQLELARSESELAVCEDGALQLVPGLVALEQLQALRHKSAGDGLAEPIKDYESWRRRTRSQAHSRASKDLARLEAVGLAREGEGGALRLTALPADSLAAPAGLQAGDLLFPRDRWNLLRFFGRGEGSLSVERAGERRVVGLTPLVPFASAPSAAPPGGD